MFCLHSVLLDTSYMPCCDWRTARIPKKSGGFRTLHIPNELLKDVQRKILTYLYSFDVLRPIANVAGFVPNRNIMTGATYHNVDTDVVINLDFKDFFDTVDPSLTAKFLVAAGVPATTVDYIIKVCTLDGKLCQGAPTSPYLTNIALMRFDALMLRFARKRSMTYTRYADDITLTLNSTALYSGLVSKNLYGVAKLNTGYIYSLIRAVLRLIALLVQTIGPLAA